MKGFTQVLEAIIASFFMIILVTTAVPVLEQADNPDQFPEEKLRSGIESLDATGALNDDRSISNIYSDVERFIPPSYNHTVILLESNSTSFNLNAPETSQSVDMEAYELEAQLTVLSADGLTVSYNGENLVENINRTGYYNQKIEATGNSFSAFGSGEVVATVTGYNLTGNASVSAETENVNYIDAEKGNMEVTVSTWPDQARVLWSEQ